MKVLLVTAMYPTPDNPAFGSFVRAQEQALSHAGVDVQVLVFQGRIRKFIYPKGLVQMRRRLADSSIDLVHAHYGYVGVIARLQWQVPVVVTYHGDDVLGTINARGRTTALSRVAAVACRSISPWIDAAIVQTEAMASRFRHANVYVVPHEVDLELFQPMDRQAARTAVGLSPTKRYLLFAANPDIAVKNYPLARAAFLDLQRCYSDLELLVVYKETQSRLAMYMNACDVLVFPSYQEGSPNVVKQAMACNMPIVATAVGDVPEVVCKTAGCFICEPRPEDFARRIEQLLQRPIKTDGREHVRHLSGPNVAKRLIAVYEQVLRGRALSRTTFSVPA
ncbi:MAG: glycosyltransferase [Terriglobales bacterium]